MDEAKRDEGKVESTAIMMGKAGKDEETQCPYCGAQIPAVEKFCPDCGYERDSLSVRSKAGSSGVVIALKIGDARYELQEGVFTIGRVDADIVVSEPYISRKHAQITIRSSKVFLTDLGSTNGTFVGGKRVEAHREVEISPAMEVKLANVPLSFEWVAESEKTQSENSSDAEPASEEVEVEACQDAEPTAEKEQEEAKMEEVSEVGSTWALCTKEKTYELAYGYIRIGRKAEKNDIAFGQDKYVSGEHLLLECDLDTLKLKDLDTTNGTFINGSRVEPQVWMDLKDGDEIRIGKTLLTVRHTPPTGEADKQAQQGEAEIVEEVADKEVPTEPAEMPSLTEAEGLDEDADEQLHD